MPGIFIISVMKNFIRTMKWTSAAGSLNLLHIGSTGRIDEYCWELADPFIHPDTREFSKETVLKKIQHVFAAYTSFKNCEYNIRELSLEWDDEKENGRAFVGGFVKYDAATETRETIHTEGRFQFYLSNTNGWWSIFYFVFPGFNWNE